ncbi:hypothetical protein [Pseudomonas sp. I3-I5]|uniref:COG4315 family predicted lipoprotein n=1 Tax=Pseudomonas sp. I3-I5 TaxID=2926671 RepID=UPI001F60F9AF|nr:hypothetical protein [Pseudomonas sp. I3-I5]UNT13460.1 hypothetical protein MOP87_20690 [Pseudomonas sp. I3-I5]
MTRHTLSWMALCAAFSLPGIALAEPAMEKEGMWVNDQGMTLYTFDKDTGGKSMCNGECASNWPPLMVKAEDQAAEGKWTVVMRDDGSKQWAYAGKPLYTFVKDKQAGDRHGDGLKDVWHIAKP